MKRLLANTLPFFLLIFFSQATLLMARGLSTEDAEKFLHDAGLTELIASFPDSMGQQLDAKRLSSNSGVDVEKTSSAIISAAQRVDGQQIAMVYLSKENRAAELAEALKFLASPLGQRISSEERLASRPEVQQEMMSYAQAQMSKPENQDRAALLKDLSVALSADKVVIQLMKGVYFSVLDTVKVINPRKAPGLERQMKLEWESMEPMLSEQFSSFMLMGASYSYRNLSDQELRTYIEFLKSEAGQVYWQVGVDIIDLYIQGFVSELVAQLSIRD